MKKNLWITTCVVLLFSLSLFLYFKNSISSPYLTVVGRIKMADGIGRQSVEVIEALQKDATISFIPTASPKFKDVPSNVKKIVKQSWGKPGKVRLYEDVLWMPDHEFFRKMPDKDDKSISIAYSMFESNVIPYEWALILNTRFDAVVVPDQYLVDVYRNSGVKLPIFVIPLGLNISTFLKSPIKQKANTPFVFANFSLSDERKNQILLIRAFAKIFGNNPNVRLILNSRFSNAQGEKIRNEIRQLNIKNIYFSELSLESKDYLKLFQSVDCYVNLSKGEGFSIQPREAMALGIPTIVTDNTSQSTICESGLVRVVSSSIEEPAFYDAYKTYHGSYFTCSMEDAAEALLDVYNNYDEYLKTSSEARKWARKYQFSNLRGLYKSLIMPKKILLGNKNEINEEYVMTDSPEFYEKYNIILGKK